MRFKLYLKYAIYITPLIVILTLIVFIYAGVQSALRMECSLHATWIATLAIDKYVQIHKEWPKSRNELLLTTVSDERIMYSFPKDIDKIEMYCTIRYNVKLFDIRNDSVAIKDCISPIGGHFTEYDRYFDQLNRTILIYGNKNIK